MTLGGISKLSPINKLIRQLFIYRRNSIVDTDKWVKITLKWIFFSLRLIDEMIFQSEKYGCTLKFCNQGFNFMLFLILGKVEWKFMFFKVLPSFAHLNTLNFPTFLWKVCTVVKNFWQTKTNLLKVADQWKSSVTFAHILSFFFSK